MLLSLFVVVPLRRLRLASGALALIVLWNAAFTVVGIPEMWIYLPAVVGSAVVGEILWSSEGDRPCVSCRYRVAVSEHPLPKLNSRAAVHSMREVWTDVQTWIDALAAREFPNHRRRRSRRARRIGKSAPT